MRHETLLILALGDMLPQTLHPRAVGCNGTLVVLVGTLGRVAEEEEALLLVTQNLLAVGGLAGRGGGGVRSGGDGGTRLLLLWWLLLWGTPPTCPGGRSGKICLVHGRGRSSRLLLLLICGHIGIYFRHVHHLPMLWLLLLLRRRR